MRDGFRWLHVNDPRCPDRADADWRDAVERSKADLRSVLSSSGAPEPFQALLVTGNLTRDGSASAYARAGGFLDDLVAVFGGRGCVVLATPGPLDGGLFDRWWSSRLDDLPPEVEVREGGRPGDYAVTVPLGGARVGFVSVDTAHGPRDPRELGAMCGESMRAWVAAHNARVMMTWQIRADHAHDGFAADQIREGDLPFNLFDVVHVAAGPHATQPTNVLRPWSFIGYSEGRQRVMATSRTVTMGEVPGFGGLAPVIRASEVDLDERAEPEVRFEASVRWFHADGPVPGPVARRPAPRPPKELTDRDVVDLVWDVLPDAMSFRGFLFEELRGHRRLAPEEAGRERQTELLVKRVGRQEVLAALKRYLPDSTERALTKLGHGSQSALDASVPRAKVALTPEERAALADLRELAQARASGCAEHSDFLAHVARALAELAAGDVGGATLTMLGFARASSQGDVRTDPNEREAPRER